ncbi:MAG: 23S rRNA (guanosine(2251)-2'-O)-methyltransferase RlmB [Pseudomonadota bacterium]
MPRKRVKSNNHRPSAQRPKSRTPKQAQKLLLFGRHAVDAALKNPRRTIHTVYAEASQHAALERHRPGVNLEVFNAAAHAGHLSPDAIHQDICAHVAPLEGPSLDVQLASKRNGPLVVLDHVTDPRNIGAIFRTSAAFGAQAIIMQDKHAPKESGTLARAASGALDMLPWIKVTNLARALESMAAAGYWSIGLAGDAPQTLEATVTKNQKIALVLGAEGAGLRRNVSNHCDTLARLDIDPVMESLNVSNAAAVALYIARRAQNGL